MKKKTSKEKRTSLALFPSPGAGHLGSMVALANQLSQHQPLLSITIFTINHPSCSDLFLPQPTSPSPSVTILNLPPPTSLPPFDSSKSILFNRCASINSYSSMVSKSLSGTSFSAFILDMFCASFSEIAAEMGIPSYLYFTSGAAFLGLLLLSQHLLDDQGVDISEMGPHILVPTFLNPLPTHLLPNVLTDKEGGRADIFLQIGRRARKMEGILVNTFQELEPHAMAALAADASIPAVYAVGPLLNWERRCRKEEEEEVMEWLEHQPESSVVFLCFGSTGSFPEEQAREIGKGVEESGYRFLLSLREYGEEVLGEGFVERNKGRGMVIGWTAQMEILGHRAVGGFVSHCGWNSTLESLWCGVGMGAWPMSSEQQVNGWQLVEEVGVAVGIRLDYRKQTPVLVGAEEIQKGIRAVMEGGRGESGFKVLEVKEKARASVEEGGSSFVAISSFLDTLS